MSKHYDSPKASVQLEDRAIHDASDDQSIDSDAKAVEKLGFTATIPRSLTRQLALIGLNSSIVLPWPAVYFVSVLNLANGGTAGLLTGSIVATLFMSAVYLSLAEKLRRYPTAGGQYHWVAALAPPRCRRFMSFLTGFMLVFTWLSTLMSAAWLFALDITAIILIYTGEYHVKWNFTIAACMCVVSLVVNCCWGKWINYPERLMVAIHLIAFTLLISVLIYGAAGPLSPQLSFSSQTGWSSSFGAVLSIVYLTAALAGFDCASHISEDAVDAKRQLPRSLLTCITANGVACIIVSVMIVLCAGNVNQLFEEPLGSSGHPIGAIVQLTYNAARENKALACAPFGLIAPLAVMTNINTTAAASRLLFSLIRDDRNPFVQKHMAKDLKPDHIPRITICFIKQIVMRGI